MRELAPRLTSALLPRSHKLWEVDSPYDHSAALRTLEHVALGRTFDQIERIRGCPPWSVFSKWLAHSGELALAYERAREVSAYVLEDEAMTLLRRMNEAPGTTQALRSLEMLVAHIRWVAEKRNPRVYAAKSAVSVTVPIQINTTLDMGHTGSGTSTHPNIYELKAENIVEVTPPVEAPVRKKPPPSKRWTPEKAAMLAARMAAKKAAKKGDPV